MKIFLLFCLVAIFTTASGCSGEEVTQTISDVSEIDTISLMETDTIVLTNDTITMNKINITVGEEILTATMVNNSSVKALMEDLSEGTITIKMQDYGSFEKVGNLGRTLPRNDEQITTEPGDLILYQGSAFVIYYAPNSWNFTRLGKIDNITQEELKDILGKGDVTVILSIP